MRISVIIPVHNAAAMLERCLQALVRSDFQDYECIVVDDGSTDHTAAVAGRFPVRIITMRSRGGPARARNDGASGACGEILVFIDSDVCVHADTLHRLDKHLRQHPGTAAVFGSYDNAPADRHFVSQYKNLFHHYVHQRSQSAAWTFWAGCGAIRRDIFAQVGGFDAAYTRPSVEDIELGLRLHTRGQRIDLNPAIQVTHLKRWTVARLIRADLRDRAIPWMRLLLRHRTMPSDLNVTTRDRASVMLVWVMTLVIAAMGIFRTLVVEVIGAALVAVCAGSVCVLNVDFYRFMARQRGIPFAMRALPLHWLYLWYCGLAVPLAVLAHAADIARAHASLAVQEEDA